MNRVSWIAVAAMVIMLLSACQPVMPMQGTKGAAPQVLVQGAPLRGVWDVAIGPDGNVYAASELARAVIVIDPATGEVVKQYGAEQGFDNTQGVAVGPDGSLYSISWLTFQMCRLSPTGEKACQQIPDDAWDMEFSPDGRLFVSGGEGVTKLYTIDPELKSPPELVTDLGSMIAHYTFGPDGLVYVALPWENKIVRADVNVQTANVETVAEGMIYPIAVDFDSQGQMYVAAALDTQESVVLRIDPATGKSEVVGRAPFGIFSLVVTPDDRVLGGHNSDGALLEFKADGTVSPVTTQGLVGPGGLAVRPRADGGESLFVADFGSLREFDGASGEPLNIWHVAWFPNAVSSPRTVAVDGDNLLIGSGDGVVQIWDPQNNAEVSQSDVFTQPANAIRFQGDLVVVEMTPDAAWRVVRTAGDDMASIHALASSSLEQPLGLAASDDNLWATDFATGKVVQLVANGEELAEPEMIAEGLVRPEGIALGPDGRLVVAETGTGRLLAIDPVTGEQQVLAEGLGFTADNPVSATHEALPPFWIFNGVAVGPSGTVYVSGDAANVIYRIPPAQ